jgi:hypothetical protein
VLRAVLRFACACLLLAGVAQAQVVVIGGTSVNLPAPPRFTNTASTAPALAEALEQFAAPGTTQLASFVTQADIAAVRKGQRPRLDRYFLVQARKQDAGVAYTAARFAELRKVLREQNAEVLRRASRELDAALRALQKRGGATAVPQGASTVEIFRDGEDGFGMLLLMNFDESNSLKNLVISGVMATTIRNKLVYLYTYSPLRTSADVAWVRSQSLAWLKAIRAANP